MQVLDIIHSVFSIVIIIIQDIWYVIWNYQHILYNLNTHNSSCSKHMFKYKVWFIRWRSALVILNSLGDWQLQARSWGPILVGRSRVLGSGFRGWGLGVSRGGAELRYIVADVCLSSQKRLGFPEPWTLRPSSCCAQLVEALWLALHEALSLWPS